jgi:hypothetical protein
MHPDSQSWNSPTGYRHLLHFPPPAGEHQYPAFGFVDELIHVVICIITVFQKVAISLGSNGFQSIFDILAAQPSIHIILIII